MPAAPYGLLFYRPLPQPLGSCIPPPFGSSRTLYLGLRNVSKQQPQLSGATYTKVCLEAQSSTDVGGVTIVLPDINLRDDFVFPKLKGLEYSAPRAKTSTCSIAPTQLLRSTVKYQFQVTIRDSDLYVVHDRCVADAQFRELHGGSDRIWRRTIDVLKPTRVDVGTGWFLDDSGHGH